MASDFEKKLEKDSKSAGDTLKEQKADARKQKPSITGLEISVVGDYSVNGAHKCCKETVRLGGVVIVRVRGQHNKVKSGQTLSVLVQRIAEAQAKVAALRAVAKAQRVRCANPKCREKSAEKYRLIGPREISDYLHMVSADKKKNTRNYSAESIVVCQWTYEMKCV